MIVLRKILTAAVAFAVILSISSASANNGIQFSEFDVEETLYIGCLGEDVFADQTIAVASHAFVTPSGNFHLVDNWEFTILWTGVATGRTWAAKLRSPFQLNIGPGETNQFVVKGVNHPLTGDGPRFFYSVYFKVTVTANGDLAVLRDSEGYSVRCLGKN